MASTPNSNAREEMNEASDSSIHKTSLPFDTSTSRRTLFSDENSGDGFSNAISSPQGRTKFLKLGSASAKFKRLAEERDEISRSVASSSNHGLRERFRSSFARKIDWSSLMRMSKEWIKEPKNLALFIFCSCVVVSGAILFLVMTGMLNSALPKKSQRDAWFEVNNQILNALFTLMCLYQHPPRFYHLVLLCRWKPEDISRLRKIYCKNGTYKPHEWVHMLVVVILLHINCFAQYALCGLNVGYKRSQRPAIGVGICLSVAIAAPAIAGVYTNISPLGKDYDSGDDEEAQLQISSSEVLGAERLKKRTLERRYSFATGGDEQKIVENNPKWSGGILDFWDDISLAYLSLFCSFCVFGWNMERLGFGNMYVHIATFILFCMAPFFIFNLAAVNIDNGTARTALSLTGIMLCLFGLLYGGFWRIQLRKRYKLPAYKFCCGKAAASDCFLWLCCCWCSLAQEVRTGNSYDIVEQKFYIKQTENGNEVPMSPFPPDQTASEFRSGPSSPAADVFKNVGGSSPSPTRILMEYHSPDGRLPTVKEELAARGKDETMLPPPQLVINKDAS